ncbi:hypothetical protein SLS62_009224 [Diatrype stigma]|uniref:Uncharacterized protein n=1 Tax=Diatrype stigma TaxID=117547 RepID=A0AAN9UQG2_9PEZI
MPHTEHDGNPSGPNPNKSVAWKKNILQCLDHLQDTGSSATRRVNKPYTDPGLTVRGHHISLPPSSQDVETIDGACGPVAFGSVVETQGDEATGVMRGLDASQFQIDNPAWESYLDSTLRYATKKLGMPPSVRAEPSKLLFFKKGCSWKFDADREETPGVIGTMLVCLPLEHSGGGVCFSREPDDTYAFDMSEHSRSSLTSITYRSGLAKEFRPLTSGHRLVLVYDITLTVSSVFPASTRHTWLDRLQSLVMRWQDQFPRTRNLAYLLKGRYDTSELTFSKLKDGDESVVDSLRAMCSRAGVYIFLVNMKKPQVDEDHDSDSDYGWDYDTTSVSPWGEAHRLHAILTLGGQAVLLVPKHVFSTCLSADNVEMQAMIDFIINDLNESGGDAYTRTANLGFLVKALDHDAMSNNIALGLLDTAIAFESSQIYHKALSVALKIPNRRLEAISKVSRLVQRASSSNPKAEINWNYWYGLPPSALSIR